MRATIYSSDELLYMKLSKDQYIKENIKLSLSNTSDIFKSMDKSLTKMIKMTQNIQDLTDDKEAMTELIKLKDMSLESIVEKCNIIKASIDRFTIPYEDVIIPKSACYPVLRSHKREMSKDPLEYARLKNEYSKTNMPTILHPIIDDGDYYDD